MRATFWGTRGSIPTPGSATARHGGNTSCVEIRPGADPTQLLVLDAGTGIAALGRTLAGPPGRIDILLSHLHLDHILGLGFFAPLFDTRNVVHIWGPGSTTLDLRRRLTRYLSPPLFPVALRELPCRLQLHDVPLGREFEVPGATVTAALVCHPGPTVGYRITSQADGATLAYLSDHEPALGNPTFPGTAAWTSGAAIAAGVDLLVHDAQYTDAEYAERVGWGHSTVGAAVAFADLVGARRLVAFHHDPAHDDDQLDRLLALRLANGAPVVAAREGLSLEAVPAVAATA
ncbi:MAG TPA: MBL fold metallo-hydrolase [Acidimicrobiales bacterium]|nr:MBL fold metallo-hydrolase [Acidimicrobiales bacterium]